MKVSIEFIQNSEFRIRNSEFRIQNSEFRIQNSEFGIQNSEFGIQNSEFRIQNCELLLTFKSYLQWYVGPILQCNSYVHNNPCCTDHHSRLGCTCNQLTPMRASYSRKNLYSTEYLNPHGVSTENNHSTGNTYPHSALSGRENPLEERCLLH